LAAQGRIQGFLPQPRDLEIGNSQGPNSTRVTLHCEQFCMLHLMGFAVFNRQGRVLFKKAQTGKSWLLDYNMSINRPLIYALPNF